MSVQEDKIDEVVLALLQLTLHDGNRAWKGYDWAAFDRLHAKGWIDNPKEKTKSLALTADGLKQSREMFRRHFGTPAQDRS